MADEGEWLVFFRTDDATGNIITIDTALQYERLNSHNWLEVRIELAVAQVIEGGLPSDEAQVSSFEFEDELEIWLIPLGGRFAAMRTGHSSRSIFIHGPPNLSVGIESIASNHRKLDISIVQAEFSDVLALMPSKLETSLARDRRIIDILKREGDDGLVPRKTLYWIYGVAPGIRSELDQRLKDLEFSIENHRDKSVTFSRTAPVQLQTIEEDTRLLSELCEDLGCTYDGWETEVVRARAN